MFTGIVEEIGLIEEVIRKKDLFTLTLQAKKVLKGVKKGDSIAIDGVCLTVTSFTKHTLTFDVMRETIEKTTLGQITPKTKVNLERALEVGSRLGGHFVTGHVDAVAVIQKKIVLKDYIELQISLNPQLAKFFVTKGSVCVDGVSLTIGKVKKSNFLVYLIPFTDKETTFGLKREGDRVNIEADILAKYILKRG